MGFLDFNIKLADSKEFHASIIIIGFVIIVVGYIISPWLILIGIPVVIVKIPALYRVLKKAKCEYCGHVALNEKELHIHQITCEKKKQKKSLKKFEWNDNNVDLKLLAERIHSFFKDEGFEEIKMNEIKSGSEFEICARKENDYFRKLMLNEEKTVGITIRGSPNKFFITIDDEEYENFAVNWDIGVLEHAVDFVLYSQSKRKLRSYIKDSVNSLTNSFRN